MKFTEIFRLKKMLEEANIPFQFSENFNGNTLFFDKEIIAWTELPEPEREV